MGTVISLLPHWICSWKYCLLLIDICRNMPQRSAEEKSRTEVLPGMGQGGGISSQGVSSSRSVGWSLREDSLQPPCRVTQGPESRHQGMHGLCPERLLFSCLSKEPRVSPWTVTPSLFVTLGRLHNFPGLKEEGRPVGTGGVWPGKSYLGWQEPCLLMAEGLHGGGGLWRLPTLQAYFFNTLTFQKFQISHLVETPEHTSPLSGFAPRGYCFEYCWAVFLVLTSAFPEQTCDDILWFNELNITYLIFKWSSISSHFSSVFPRYFITILLKSIIPYFIMTI